MFTSLFTKKSSQIIHFSFLVLPLFHGIYASCNTAMVYLCPPGVISGGMYLACTEGKAASRHSTNHNGPRKYEGRCPYSEGLCLGCPKCTLAMLSECCRSARKVPGLRPAPSVTPYAKKLYQCNMVFGKKCSQ